MPNRYALEFLVFKQEIYNEILGWIIKIIKILRTITTLINLKLETDCGTESDNKIAQHV